VAPGKRQWTSSEPLPGSWWAEGHALSLKEGLRHEQ